MDNRKSSRSLWPVLIAVAALSPATSLGVGRCNQAIDPQSKAATKFVNDAADCKSSDCKKDNETCAGKIAADDAKKAEKMAGCKKTASDKERQARIDMLKKRWDRLQKGNRTTEVANCVCGGTNGDGRAGSDADDLKVIKKRSQEDSGGNHGMLCYCTQPAQSHKCNSGYAQERGAKDPLRTQSPAQVQNAYSKAMKDVGVTGDSSSWTADQRNAVIDRARFYAMGGSVIPAASYCPPGQVCAAPANND
jgi:hypothetical protein